VAGRRRSTSRRRASGRYQWINTVLGAITTVAQDTQAITEVLSVLSDTIQATAYVRRIVGSYSVRPLTQDADYRYLFACEFLSQDALTAGALPELIVDNAAYLYWEKKNLLVPQTLIGSNDIWVEHKFDVKLNRKFRNREQRIAFQFENRAPTNVSISYDFGARILIWLP